MKNFSTTNTHRGNRWLAVTRPRHDADLRLFCFPYAGGGSSIYRSWAEALPQTIEVCPVQLPGRETRLRETPHTSLLALAESTGRALLPHLDKPFAFFGHSMGAMLGFALARWLRREHGVGPEHLFVSGRWAPHVVDPNPPTYNLPEPEFLEKVRDLNGTPEEVFSHRELLQLMIPLLRADFAVCQTYVYEEEEPLECPITVYGGLQDIGIKRPLLDEWQRHTSASFLLRMFLGDHFFLHSAQRQLLLTLAHDLIGVADAMSRRMTAACI